MRLEDVLTVVGRFFLHIYKTLLNRYATSDDIIPPAATQKLRLKMLI
jgi:hypothetical protein